uniref:Uncharacterized protein n=1 Tax=Glossina austeni TaxID=7395 RepID=A0A1A9V1W0_GLOAU
MNGKHWDYKVAGEINHNCCSIGGSVVECSPATRAARIVAQTEALTATSHPTPNTREPNPSFAWHKKKKKVNGKRVLKPNVSKFYLKRKKQQQQQQQQQQEEEHFIYICPKIENLKKKSIQVLSRGVMDTPFLNI